MTRVLITGATGGLGRNAVERALSEGWRVTATGRRGDILRALVARGANTYQADLVSLPGNLLVELMDLQDVVWHCAALAAPWGVRSDFIEANAEMPARLFEAAGRAGVSTFVHISSPALYFDYKHHRCVSENYRAAHFASFYAESKALGEERLQELARAHPGTRLVILRPRIIFGPYDQVVFPRILKFLARHHDCLVLPNGGRALVDMVYVENVVEALILASKFNVESGSVFNISNGEPVVLREALTAMLRAMGRKVEVLSLPYSLLRGAVALDEWLARLTNREPALTSHTLGGMAFDMTLDIRAAEHHLGYRPLVRMAEGLQRTAKWLNSSGSLAINAV
ncbi:NAD(P)-dependent oxidoreductase [Burkholderia multivorans]|nr:NAD(P)-dependent oxidoreductase [Burkholderia multivorans]